MKRIHAAAIGALFLAPSLAMAGGRGHQGGSFLDLFYVPKAKYEQTVSGSASGSGSIDGDGFSIRGLARAGNNFAVTGEYGSLSYDDDTGYKLDDDQARLGLGMAGPTGSGVFVQWEKHKQSDNSSPPSEVTMDGYALHGRLAGDVSPQIHIYGEAGYAQLKDDNDFDWKGPEFAVGFSVGLSDAFALVADYRIQQLKTTNVAGTGINVEDEYKDLRVGGRLTFGG